MYVYLIGCENSDKYKIGISKNPAKRLTELQTANGDSLELINVFNTRHGFACERAVQGNYASNKTIGEWFQLDDTAVSKFSEVCAKVEANFDVLLENTYLQDKGKKWGY